MCTPSPVTCAVGHPNAFGERRSLWYGISDQNWTVDDLRDVRIVGTMSLCFSRGWPNVSFDCA